MPFEFGTRSLARLVGVHPDLVRVCKKAIYLSEVDFMVGEGVRSATRQAELYAQGRTKPGPKVTWVRKSNHQIAPDGLGHAVDLWAIDPKSGAIDWGTLSLYESIKEAMFAAASEEPKVHLRWGGDWDEDGVHEHGESDLAHFEIHL